LLLAAVCALLLVPQLAGRFSSLADTPTQANQPSGNSLVWRVGYWTQVLPLADSNPITGIGLNMTQYETTAAKQPHNDFIRAYVETGLVGLGAYVVMLFSLLRTGRRAVRRTLPGTLDRGIAVGFLGCASAFIAVSLAANVLSNVVTLWYLVAFAAAASAICRQYSRRAVVPAVPPPA
jgi:O-antigen ligase